MEPLDPGHDAQVELPALESDDELRLMFLCCDPVLTRAAQVAPVLNVAFGLSARQIATAFLSDERTVAQRIVRAKQRLRDEGVRFDVPEGVALSAQLAAILDVLYVVFSEGYNPTDDDAALDASLCNEALRLVRLVTETKHTAVAPAFALRALLCFHASRAPARLADDGSLLLMPEQDRARWDGALMALTVSRGSGDRGMSRDGISLRDDRLAAHCRTVRPAEGARAVARGRRQSGLGDGDAIGWPRRSR
jgi:predicted RNA polymerase sigma factor